MNPIGLLSFEISYETHNIGANNTETERRANRRVSKTRLFIMQDCQEGTRLRSTLVWVKARTPPPVTSTIV